MSTTVVEEEEERAGTAAPPPINGRGSWLSGWLPSWRPTSEQMLASAERVLLDGELACVHPVTLASPLTPSPHYSHTLTLHTLPTHPTTIMPQISHSPLPDLASDYTDLFVPVGPDAVLRTIVMEARDRSEPEATPLVLVHGLNSGLPHFHKNYDHLHDTRRLYAIDLPGFARSSRVNFTPDEEAVEQEFVDFIERWRQEVGLEKFILLGHSLGAFLSTAYAMRHPSRVRHLLVVEPWGFPVRPEAGEREQTLPLWIKAIISFSSMFNLFTPLRAAGPMGERLGRD